MTLALLVAETSTTGLALRLVMSLGLVLGLIAGLVWLARTRGGALRLGLGAASNPIQVRGRSQLNRNNSLTLVEVGKQSFLIAAWEQGVQVIAEGEDLLPVAEPTDIPGDRTSPSAGPDGSVPARTNLFEALREWSVRRS